MGKRFTRTEEFEVVWVHSKFLLFKEYKAARDRMRLYCGEKCWRCREMFRLDEAVSVANIALHGNEFVCEKCAAEFTAALETGNCEAERHAHLLSEAEKRGWIYL